MINFLCMFLQFYFIFSIYNSIMTIDHSYTMIMNLQVYRVKLFILWFVSLFKILPKIVVVVVFLDIVFASQLDSFYFTNQLQ